LYTIVAATTQLLDKTLALGNPCNVCNDSLCETNLQIIIGTLGTSSNSTSASFFTYPPVGSRSKKGNDASNFGERSGAHTTLVLKTKTLLRSKYFLKPSTIHSTRRNSSRKRAARQTSSARHIMKE
jgi:hypothetical protein